MDDTRAHYNPLDVSRTFENMIRPYGNRYRSVLNYLLFLGLRFRVVAFLARQIARALGCTSNKVQDSNGRLQYYCKPNTAMQSPPVDDLSTLPLLGKSRYKADLARIFWPLPLRVRCHFLLGDITRIPAVPSLVKSRPIGGGNANNVLLPLDAQRHFQFVADPLSFEDKVPRVIWRGAAHHKRRKEFLLNASKFDCLDLGVTASKDPRFATFRKPFTPIEDQLRYKFILSVEGKDVATNLKWIMSSNSLCFMPKPLYETWFMEGTLIAGVHYVEIRDDAANLEEMVDHYTNHPDEAKTIIQNANAYAKQFKDITSELAIAREVVMRYARATGQVN